MSANTSVDRSEIETVISTLWKNLLEINQVAPTDNFFDLGGNSMAALKLILEVENTFGLESLTPEQVYSEPTLDGMITAVETNVV